MPSERINRRVDGLLDQASHEESAAGDFVGRRDELDQLRVVLEDSLLGNGKIVTVTGDPGIGKTRTAQEISTYASTRGVQVIWGRCYEERGAPPYCPWRQAIGSLAEQLDHDSLAAYLGAGAPEISEIIPSIADLIPGLGSPPVLEPAPARFRLFESITTLLKNAAESESLLIILDDFQWADRPSLMLLEYLSRELSGSRILVLVTYRDLELTRRHPLVRTLGELVKEPSFERIRLRGLTQPEVSRFIENSIGMNPPSELVKAIYEQTEGNALFVTEVVRLLVQEGVLDPDNLAKRRRWSISIPEGVRVVIGARLDNLSETCNQILTIAAVIGRDFDFDLLERLSSTLGISTEDLHDALDEAQAAQLIHELPGASLRFRFTHSIIQQTLVDEHSTMGRMRTHNAIAEAIEGMHKNKLDEHSADLAYHLSQAGSGVDAEKLARYVLIAGEQALESYAYEEAIELFEIGLARKDSSESDDQLPLLLHGLGRANAAVLDTTAASEALTQASDIYVENQHFNEAIEIACSPVGYLETGDPDLISRALELVEPNSHQFGRLISHRGAHLGDLRDYEGAIQAFDEAVSIAQRERDVELEMWTQARAGSMEIYLANYDRCVERDGRAVQLNQQIQDPRIEAHAGMCATYSLLGQGDLRAARDECVSMLSVAEGARHRQGMVSALEIHSLVQICEGDWKGATENLNRALELAPARLNGLAYRALIEFLTGDLNQTESHLDSLLDVYQGEIGWHVPQHVLTHIGHSIGRRKIIDSAKMAAESEISTGGQDVMAEARLTLGLAAVATGDMDSAAEQYSALSKISDSCVTLYFLSVDRVRGLLSELLGRVDQAAVHFENAIEYGRRVGYLPEFAIACADYAQILLNRSDAGDVDRANDLLVEANTTAERLGMNPLLVRIAGLQQRVADSGPRTAETYPDGLTEREVEVLRLIHAGNSNQKIADELFLSRYTVVRHVANIFGKIGVTNRTEAGIYAERNALTDLMSE